MQESKKPFDANRLEDAYVNTEISDRKFAHSLATLAADLARQAGEEVKRPLSRDQLARALRVNSAEWAELYGLMQNRWRRLHKAGELKPPTYLDSDE